MEKGKREEEDNKEQCSPVSVLDHPFEDEDDGGGGGGEDDCDPECSNYSTLQSTVT